MKFIYIYKFSIEAKFRLVKYFDKASRTSMPCLTAFFEKFIIVTGKKSNERKKSKIGDKEDRTKGVIMSVVSRRLT